MSLRPTIVAATAVAEDTHRGGSIRIVISPTTAGSTCGILGICNMQPGEVMSPYVHDYGEEMLYVVRGAVTVVWEDGEEQVPHGNAILVPKGLTHSYRNDSEEELMCVFAAAPLAPTMASGHRDVTTR
jgi:putative monooxygenase